jgi:hypothetical protein
MFALLITACLSRCYRFENAAVQEGNFDVPPDGSFAIDHTSLTNVSLTITLSIYPANFFGTASDVVPDSITIVQEAVGSATQLDYDDFRADVPIFCSRGVTDNFTKSVSVPESATTDDLRTLDFLVHVRANSSHYSECFGESGGSCVVLQRVIREFESQGVDLGTCVGLIFGVFAGGVLCALCIIWLEPIVKKHAERDRLEKERGDAEPQTLSDAAKVDLDDDDDDDSDGDDYGP